MTETQLPTASRPLRAALLLTGLTAVGTLVAAVLLRWLAPGLEPMEQKLAAVVALAVLAVVVAARRPGLLTSGRLHPGLLALPLLLALVPFAGGIKDAGLRAGAIIVLGYLATGIYEEFWFRGLVLESLAAWTPLKAALLSSALFGTAHLANIAFGANPAITAAQVVGAACFGVGLAALRLRGVSLWPLAAIHALSDIALQLGDVGSAWRWALMIGGDTVLLIFGFVILRRASRGGAAVGNTAVGKTGARPS